MHFRGNEKADEDPNLKGKCPLSHDILPGPPQHLLLPSMPNELYVYILYIIYIMYIIMYMYYFKRNIRNPAGKEDL